MRFLIVALSALLLAACSEPRIDASSDTTLDASIAKVRESLPADQRGEFDALVAQAGTVDTADGKAAVSATAPTQLLAPIDGMSGPQALETLRGIASRRAAEHAAAEERRQAEQAARDAKRLAALSARHEAHEASLAALRSIGISELRPEIRKAGQRRSYGIVAKVHNTLDSALDRITFDYSVTRAGSNESLGKGTGEFIVKQSLKPGETRKLEASAGEGGANGIADAVKALDEHADAALAITITDATDAQGKSILAPALTATEVAQRDRLRASKAATATATAKR